MEAIIRKTRIILLEGDITDQSTDAIVNAANPGLMGGGGVDGAIHRRGGPEILMECKSLRKTLYPEGLPDGKAVITTGGKLKAGKVIHTVGPVWNGGDNKEHEILAQAYTKCLKVAFENSIKTISFPSISTGAYGYPVEKASKVALSAVADFVRENEGIEEVRFILHIRKDLQIYQTALREVLEK